MSEPQISPQSPAEAPAPPVRQSLSIVIPIHNESAVLESAVGAILEKLRPLGFDDLEIVLVENGSTDGTADTVKELMRRWPEIRLVSLEVADYGAALRAGMEAARGTTIANFDIDYWDVPFVRDAAMLIHHRFDIVIGSKNLSLSADRRSFMRRIVSQGFRLVLRLVFGLRASDTHGIKVWKNSAKLQELMRRVRFDHSLYDTELILRGQYAGLRVVELPVEVVETRRSSWGILRRIPSTARDLLVLRGVLWRERLERR